MVLVCRCVVDVGRNPGDVADALRLEEAEQVRELVLAAADRRVAVGEGLLRSGAVSDHEAERHVTRDELPRGARA